MDLLMVADQHGLIQACEVATRTDDRNPGADIAGLSLTDLVRPEEAGAITDLFARSTESGHATTTLHVCLPGEEPRALEATCIPLPREVHQDWHVIALRDLSEQHEAENQIYATEARFRTLVEQTPALVYVSPLDTPGMALYVNPYIETLLGYTAAEWQEDPMLWVRLLHPDDRERVRLESSRTRDKGFPFDLEYRLLTRTGREVWVQDRAVIVSDQNGKPQVWQGVLVDITSRKQTELLLNSQKAVLEQIAEGVPLTDSLALIAQALEACADGMFCSILLADATGTTLQLGAAPSLPPSFRDATDGIPISPASGPCGAAAYHRRPVLTEDIATNPLWANISAPALEAGLRSCWSTPILSSAGQVLGTFGAYYRSPHVPSDDDQRLTAVAVQLGRIAIERQQIADRLTHQAFYDALTDLPNRALFEDRLSHALVRSQRSARSLAVLFVDLDDFKTINDRFGHDVGDQLLVLAAERLCSCVRVSDTVARFGGDEFVLLLEEETSEAETGRVIERILDHFRQPFSLAGSELVITPSIGIAFSRFSSTEPRDLVREADHVMYSVKRERRQRVIVQSSAEASTRGSFHHQTKQPPEQQPHQIDETLYF